MTDTSALARELAAVVSRVEGVASLYPADVAAVAADVVARVGRAVGREVAEPQLVSVVTGDDGVRVRVRIAIVEWASARDVCASVFTAVRAHLGSAEVDSIEVRVGSIG